MVDNFWFIAFSIVILWLSILTFYLLRTILHYRRLIEGSRHKNLAAVLDNILNTLAKNKYNIKTLKEIIDRLENEGLRYIQKVGVLRFNPFTDTGGEQSFVLVILDERDTGVVLTSLHSRDKTRWYVKNVKEGKGVDYALSKEEIEAIKQAASIKKKKD